MWSTQCNPRGDQGGTERTSYRHASRWVPSWESPAIERQAVDRGVGTNTTVGTARSARLLPGGVAREY